MNSNTYVLTITCADQNSIIAAVSGCISENGGNILKLAQHTAVDINMFFCRIKFEATENFDLEAFKKAFSKLEEKLYLEFPELQHNNIYFISNGNPINRVMSLKQNKIKNGAIILINYYE